MLSVCVHTNCCRHMVTCLSVTFLNKNANNLAIWWQFVGFELSLESYEKVIQDKICLCTQSLILASLYASFSFAC